MTKAEERELRDYQMCIIGLSTWKAMATKYKRSYDGTKLRFVSLLTKYERSKE